jgi:hypothetical protein
VIWLAVVTTGRAGWVHIMAVVGMEVFMGALF